MTQKTDMNELSTPEQSGTPEDQAAESAKKAKAKSDKKAQQAEGKTTIPQQPDSGKEAPAAKAGKRASVKASGKADAKAEKKAAPRKAKKEASKREKKAGGEVKKQGSLIEDIRLYDVIEKPVITEKSTYAAEQHKVVFQISPSASKTDVRKAVEALFAVQVEKVNTIKTKGKIKRFRGRTGQRSDQRKAIVTLKEGQTIDLAAGIK